MTRVRKGFTLVELLIVVAIIAVLSAVGLSLFTNAQRRSRDARRRADLRQIQNALEQWMLNYGTGEYPSEVQYANEFIAGGQTPPDPRSGSPYNGYNNTDLGTTVYNVCADLEIEADGSADTGWDGLASDVCVRNLQ